MLTLQKNYAELALRRGVNVQAGQILVISSPIVCADFVHLLTKQAYSIGASDVIVHYDDPVISRLRLLHAEDSVLEDVPRWMTEAQTHYGDRNAAFLRISSEDPHAMDGVRAEKASLRKKAVSKPLAAFNLKRMSNDLSWSVIPVPNPAWAALVYPDKTESEAMHLLWQACFDCCYVTAESGISGWDAHIDDMLRIVRAINALSLTSLHFTNAKGTDLTLSMCRHGVFAGGIAHCPEPDGVCFAPNIPTEEILTTPHRFSAEGVVYNTLPLVYNGGIVDDFCLTFRKGVVVDYQCAKGEDILRGILSTDEGSSRLGEVALVPYDSPIRKTGVLFYNTLFDENASCHLALGAGYVDVLHGPDRSTEALVDDGLNLSALHVDFMFGSADMLCVGTTADGRTVTILKDGVFAL